MSPGAFENAVTRCEQGMAVRVPRLIETAPGIPYRGLPGRIHLPDQWANPAPRGLSRVDRNSVTGIDTLADEGRDDGGGSIRCPGHEPESVRNRVIMELSCWWYGHRQRI